MDQDAHQQNNIQTGDEDFSNRFTIGWICATLSEIVAARAALDQDCGLVMRPGCSNVYRHGRIGSHPIIMGAQTEMGQKAARQLAQQMKSSFKRIQDFLVVGVAGGIPEYSIGTDRQPIVLGDVVISCPLPLPSFPPIVRADRGTYVSGKFKIAHFSNSPLNQRFKAALTTFQHANVTDLLNPRPMKLQPDLVELVLRRARDINDSSNDHVSVVTDSVATDPGAGNDYLISPDHPHPDSSVRADCGEECLRQAVKRSQRSKRAQRKAFSPYVHMGHVASFDSFMADPIRRDKLGEEGFLCVEMESASIAEHYPTITIRGIMDYCDSHRAFAKEWRSYAAVTAAAVARSLISYVAEDTDIEMPLIASGSQKRQRASTDTYHHLMDMPDLCRPYQRQDTIQSALEKFCLPDSERQARKKVLYGMVGRGKTQACVALIRDILDKQLDRWSHLLWLPARTPRALFESLQNMQENLGVPKTKRQDQHAFTVAQRAKSTAMDICKWLSRQEQPWLAIIDKLVLDHTIETDTDMDIQTMEAMLKTLFNAENGRIVITSRYPMSQQSASWDLPLCVPEMSKETASRLVKNYLYDGHNCPSELQAITKLCKLLDYLPQLISLACTKIREEKISVESYVNRWQEVLDEAPRGGFSTKADIESFNVTLRLSYDGLRESTIDNAILHPIDLLNILACMNGSYISEAIFSRAWQSYSSIDEQAKDGQESEAWTPMKGFKSVVPSLLRRLFQVPALESKPIRLKFLTRQSGEAQWEGSAAQRYLRAALKELEDRSFLKFTDHPVDSIIRISPLVQAWIRKYPFAFGSLRETEFRLAWRQTTAILATSLRPESWGESRHSKLFANFQMQAASHIEQLRRVSNGLDCAREPALVSEDLPVWTSHILALPHRLQTAEVFADTLSAHGYPAMALQILDARTSAANLTKNSVDELVSSLVYADSLDQNGKYRKALERRQDAAQALEHLRISDPATGESVKPDSIQLKLLRLIVERDIANSHWNLGSRDIASQSLDIVHANLEGFQIPPEAHSSDYFRTLLTETKLDIVQCLVRHKHNYDKAAILIEGVLDHVQRRAVDHSYVYHLHLRALSLGAEILSARGQYSEALRRRKEILEKRLEIDMDMRQLDTMIAQMAYANSMSILGMHQKSLQLRQKVEEQLSQLDCTVPQEHEFYNESRQNLAKCYMEFAETLYDSELRRYKPQGIECISRAVDITQHVLKSRQNNDAVGPLHAETFATLAQTIQYERKAKEVGSDCGIKRWIADTEFRKISSLLAERRESTTNAWLTVLIQDCLSGDREERIKGLQSLEERFDRLECLQTTTSDVERREREKMRVWIHCEIASANMKPIYQCRDQQEIKAMRKEPRFIAAAEDLEDVWKQRKDLMDPKHPTTIASLRLAISAYKLIKDDRYLELQAELCTTVGKVFGDQSVEAEEERRNLRRGQKEKAKVRVHSRG